MPRPKPTTTLNQLFLFATIAFAFVVMQYKWKLQPIVLLFFGLIYLTLGIMKYRGHIKAGESTGKGYAVGIMICSMVIIGVSIWLYIDRLPVKVMP